MTLKYVPEQSYTALIVHTMQAADGRHSDTRLPKTDTECLVEYHHLAA